MNDMLQIEWVDKYRPITLDDYVIDDVLRVYFKNMINSGKLISFSIAGVAGCGKTTLAKIIANEVNAETLFIKCATEGNVDTLRSKVEPFCNAMSIDGRPKIVILDEVDSASSQQGSSFQMGLRTLIEAAQIDTRFILTANYQNKIIPAVLSRCPLIPLKYSQKDLLLHIKKILDAEKISYTKESLKAFVEEAFHFYPDCRKIIKHLQFCCANGALEVTSNSVCDTEKTEFITNIVSQVKNNEPILNIRKWYIQNKEKLIDFIEGSSLLFNNIADNDLVTNEGLLKLADLLYQINIVIDKESTFFAMLVALRKYAK